MSMALISAIGLGFGSIASGIGAGVGASKEEEALRTQAKQMEQLARDMQQAVVDGKMTLGDMLGRLDSHMTKVGGQLKQWYDNQMAIGTELIQSNLKSSLDQVKFNINEAKIRADRQERDHLEEKERQVKRLEEDFDKSNQELANQAVKRRLSSSGFFAAALNKSQETFGKVVNELERTSSRALRAIGEQFTDVARAGGFQTLQAQAQAGRQGLGLQAQVGGQFAQQQMAQERFGFGARESAYEKALSQKFGQLGVEQQAKGFKTQAGAVSPWPSFLGGFGGTLTGLGTELFGEALKKRKTS